MKNDKVLVLASTQDSDIDCPEAPDTCPTREEERIMNASPRHYTVYESTFRPCPPTTNILPPGLYSCDMDSNGLYFRKLKVDTTDLIRFPGSMPEEIIKEFSGFWAKKALYQERGEPHKRGFLLWGPPGGGKSCTVSLITKDFIENGNIVIQFSMVTMEGLARLRSIEPDRKVMIVIEDIDSFLEYNDVEQKLLQFLDGDRQYSNLVVIATTNFPEALGDRIINRPSRFDRVAEVSMPTKEDRQLYLEAKAKSTSKDELAKWVSDTEDWTLAHLKELIAAVEIYDLSYGETIRRINEMRGKKAHSSQYTKKLRGGCAPGFGS